MQLNVAGCCTSSEDDQKQFRCGRHRALSEFRFMALRRFPRW
ncbi:hypothetical protein SynA1560_01652 [Synechococcus sp. A15-60]|nr:hypothetical protein SynA1560_01652 [Synechococcus sp. A15-60]